MDWKLKLFFIVALIALVFVFLYLLNRNKPLGFSSKETQAIKIFNKLGGKQVRDLRYNDFIEAYPEGDNALYSDIKKLDIIDVPSLMTIL
jgi:hypothetical protein